jgi:uncharacterized protein YdaU (DUF1376 family)
MKAPAFQLYAGDFLVGTAMMTAEEVGGYIRLLCYQWTQGSIPNDDAMLQRLTGCGGNAVASIRHKFGIDLAGGLVNARLEQVRQESISFRNRQAENARNGWETRRKARPGNAKPYGVAMPSHMPERCSSSSSSSSNNTTPPPIETDKKQSGGEKKKVQREPLIDALATIGGGRLEEVTNWKTAAYARSQIVAVTPELTVEEIKRRAANYRSHFEGAALTPTALAKHWALCAAPKQSFADNGPRVTRVQL